MVTSHGLVLLYVAANGDATIREVALALQLTERRVVAIIKDLADENLLRVTRVGRRNSYILMEDAGFRHSVLSHIPFASFVELWKSWEGRTGRGARKISARSIAAASASLARAPEAVSVRE